MAAREAALKKLRRVTLERGIKVPSSEEPLRKCVAIEPMNAGPMNTGSMPAFRRH